MPPTPRTCPCPCPPVPEAHAPAKPQPPAQPKPQPPPQPQPPAQPKPQPQPPAQPKPKPQPPPQPKPQPPPTDAGLVPSKFVCEGRTHYFQIPPNAKGTVVYLHGCCRMAEGFWPPSAKAPECLGFPEDVSHTKQILAKKYAVLVPTPVDQKLLGFSFSAGDHKALVEIIGTFLAKHNLEKKPVILAGASAGGGMALRITGYLKKWNVAGIIAEVATNQGVPDDDPHFPPVAFVVMERDTESQVEARHHVACLKKGGSRGAMVISPIRKVGPTYFSDRMPGVSVATSARVAETLRTIGMLDAAGNLLKYPKDEEWTKQFKKLLPALCGAPGPFSTFAIRKSPFMQAMLVAWGQHEHVADYTTAALTWLESGGNFQDLAAKLVVPAPTAFRV